MIATQGHFDVMSPKQAVTPSASVTDQTITPSVSDVTVTPSVTDITITVDDP